MPHDVFEGKTYKYLFSGVDVASRYGVAKPLMTKKSSLVVFLLGAIYKKRCSASKYSKDLQVDSASEFKSEVTQLFEKHNVKIRRATTKYKHTHTSFLEACNKKLKKLLFKPMDA